MLMKLRWCKQGGHYHCTLFTRRPPGETWENSGMLVFREEEWEAVPRAFRQLAFEEVESRPMS